MLHRYRQLYILQSVFTVEDIYVDISKYVERNSILQIMKLKDHYREEKTKKVVGLMKDELSRKIITEFVALRLRT